MNRKDIEKKLEDFYLRIKEQRGYTPRLFTLEGLRGDFIAGVLKYGESAQPIYKYLRERGWTGDDLSLSSVHRYVREIFGKFPRRGRPPKFLAGEYRRSQKRKYAS